MKNEDVNINNADTMIQETVDIITQGAGKISSALLGMVNRVGGQIYALLFVSEKTLSLDEISEKLVVSKSNISINIRMLESYGLVKKVWVKGSRKDYYTAERTYPKKVIGGFLEKIRNTLDDAIETIEDAKDKALETRKKLHEENRREINFVIEQLNLLGMFYYGAHDFFNNFFSGKPVDIDLLRNAILNPEDFISKSKKGNS